MATVEPSSRQDYMNNKNAAYNSKMKGLLYGASDRPITPANKQGRRSVPHAGGGSNVAAPFATFNEEQAGVTSIQGGQVSKTYQALHNKKEGATKVSSTNFDPEVYRQAIMDNIANRSAQKARAWGTGNIFGASDANKPPGTAAAQAPSEHESGAVPSGMLDEYAGMDPSMMPDYLPAPYLPAPASRGMPASRGVPASRGMR